MRPWLTLIIVLGALTACACASAGNYPSSPSASPSSSAQADCERGRGLWLAEAGFCSYPPGRSLVVEAS